MILYQTMKKERQKAVSRRRKENRVVSYEEFVAENTERLMEALPEGTRRLAHRLLNL